MRKGEWELRPVRKLNPWHALRAREAFFKALVEAGFESELQSFAREYPAPAFRFDEACRESPTYAPAMHAFCERRGLTSEWFLEYCHDLNWASHHSIPKRIYGHRLPSVFSTLKMTLEPSKPAMPSRHSEAARQAGYFWGGAFWLEDTKPKVRDEVLDAFSKVFEHLREPTVLRLRFEIIDRHHRSGMGAPTRGESLSGEVGLQGESIAHARETARAAFHELWDDTIQPARRERGAGTRRRRLGTAERDALAFVGRVRLRGEGKRHGQALTSMTVALLQEARGYQGLEEEQVKKALTKFGSLLRVEL